MAVLKVLNRLSMIHMSLEILKVKSARTSRILMH